MSPFFESVGDVADMLRPSVIRWIVYSCFFSSKDANCLYFQYEL